MDSRPDSQVRCPWARARVSRDSRPGVLYSEVPRDNRPGVLYPRDSRPGVFYSEVALVFVTL